MISQFSVTKLYSLTKDDLVAYPCKDSRDGRQSLIAFLTGLYAINLILMAIVFEVSVYVTPDQTLHDQIFYLYLYIVSLVFFIFCDVFMFNHDFSWGDIFQTKAAESRRQEKLAKAVQAGRIEEAEEKKQKVSHSSRSAGSLYLRLGCVVFGLAGLVYFGLELVSRIRKGKDDPLKITNLILASMFTFAQMFFIFRNSQLTIHRCKLICRFGCMHLVATNVCTWIRYLLVEEMHTYHDVTNAHQIADSKDTHDEKRHKRDSSSSSENHNGFSKHINEGLQNVTTLISHTTTMTVPHPENGHDKPCDGGDISCQVKGFNPFLTTCLIEYSIICAAIMFILWLNIGSPPTHKSKFRKQNFRVDCSASTKGLFIGLFFNVVIIVTMIIFFAQMNEKQENDTALYILLSSDSILYIFAIAAIIYGGYQMRNLSFVAQHKAATLLLLDDLLLFVGLIGQITYCLFSVVSLMSYNELTALLILATSLRLAQVLLQTLFIVSAQRLIALTPYLQQKKPGREVVTFLLMVNLALFLINTFETQKASAHPTMVNFYGHKTWSVLVHSMVPLTIFYRFHSTVCLAEIWKNAYREKAPEAEE